VQRLRRPDAIEDVDAEALLEAFVERRGKPGRREEVALVDDGLKRARALVLSRSKDEPPFARGSTGSPRA
jgi:hypothetical protein